MKIVRLSILPALFGWLWGVAAIAQTFPPDRVRYLDEVFEEYFLLKGILYAEDQAFASQDKEQLYLDVYQPTGDSLKSRPVILWAPGGGYMPQSAQAKSPNGSRLDSSVVWFCEHFARMGYVSVAFDYRKGWSINSEDPKVLQSTYIRAAYRAMQDGRAAVRFVRSQAKNFNIDTNRIVLAGLDSGGGLVYHVLYWDKPHETQFDDWITTEGKPYINPTLLGDFEGRGGTAGVSSRIAAGVSLSGGLIDTTFIEGGEPPLIALHGVQDIQAPFRTYPYYSPLNFPVQQLSGGHDAARRAYTLGNQAPLLPAFQTDFFPGFYPLKMAGTNPYAWFASSSPAEKAQARAYCDTAALFMAPRLKHILQLEDYVFLSRTETPRPAFQLYPNPCGAVLNLALQTTCPAVAEVWDVAGRTLLTQNISDANPSLSLANLPAGVYSLRLRQNGATAVERFVKLNE